MSNTLEENLKCVVCGNSIEFSRSLKTCCKKCKYILISRKTKATRLKNDKDSYIKGGKKASETRENTICKNGLTIEQNAEIKRAAKRNIIVNGKTKKQHSAEKMNITKSKIKENGLTGYQIALLKARKTKLEDVDKDGLNAFDRAAITASQTKLNDIDENGLSGYDRIVIKAKQTKLDNIDENGLNTFQRIAIKAAQTRRNDIDENGFDGNERLARKSVQTKFNDIDENGLNGFDRAFIKAIRMKKHAIANLFYQGSFEKYFIDNMIKFEMIKNLKRGSSFKYHYQNVLRYYHPDFQYLNNIFEIKSRYTYDNNGFDLERRKHNNSKYESVIEKGYDLIIVFQKVKLLKVDFVFNVEHDLFNDARCVSFTKDNLLKLMTLQEKAAIVI